MENASKALIIAGAILIAIILISVSLIVLNSTKGVVDQGNQSAKIMEVEVYNSQFTKYCGNRVLGVNVKNLKNFVDSYNSANDPNVDLEPDNITINPNKYYNVTPNYGTNGYITSITISNIT